MTVEVKSERVRVQATHKCAWMLGFNVSNESRDAEVYLPFRESQYQASSGCQRQRQALGWGKLIVCAASILSEYWL